MSKYIATADSIVDEEIFELEITAKNYNDAWEQAMDHFMPLDYIDHGTIDIKRISKPRKLSKEWAKSTIEEFKDETAYFGKNNTSILGDKFNTYDFLYEMFRDRFGMGRAETKCIIASLIIAGADIRR